MKKILKILTLLLLLSALGLALYTSLNLKEDQNPEDSSAATDSSYPFSGTFLSADSMSESQIEEYFAEISKIKMDTVIIASTRERNGTCDDLTFAWKSGFPNKISKILQLAETYNIDIYIGLDVYAWQPQCDKIYIEEPVATATIEDTKFAVNQITESYGNNSRFKGWYITDEPHLYYWYEPEKMELAYTYYKGLVDAIHLYSNKTILIAPGFGGAEYETNPTPADAAERAKTFVDNTGVDILVWQDSLGAVGINSFKYNVSDYYSAISQAIGKEKLWADTELFNCCTAVTGYGSGGSYRPALLVRILEQIKQAPLTAVSKRVVWSHDVHMSSVWPQHHKESVRLNAEYLAYFGNIGEYIKPASYELVTPALTTYPDDGTKLFDMKPGDPILNDTSGWVGFSEAAEIKINLSVEKTINWVSASLVEKDDLSISIPDSMEVICVNDTNQKSLGTFTLASDSWGVTPAEGNSEYVMSNIEPLNATCTALIVKLTNSNKILISEISIVGDEAALNDYSSTCSNQDTNGDEKISLVDLSNLLSKYNSSCSAGASYGVCGSQDSNNDGKIGLVDLSNLLSKYNANCQ